MVKHPAGHDIPLNIYNQNETGVMTIIVKGADEKQNDELTSFIAENISENGHNCMVFDYTENKYGSIDASLIDLDTVMKYAINNYKTIGLLGVSKGCLISNSYASGDTNIKHSINISPLPMASEELLELEENITTLTCPTLFCHGTADITIPHSETENLFKQAHHPKELLLIMDADHEFNIKRHKQNLCTQIINWLNNIH